MTWDAWSVVFTGLSLTCVTAVVLFFMVAYNPKDAAYGSSRLRRPAALAFNRASAWAARRKMIESVKTAGLRDPLAS